jgi:hypothetical protein
VTLISNFSGNLGNHLMTYLLTRTVAEKNGFAFGFNPKPEFDYLQGQSQLDMLFDLDYGEEHPFTYYEVPDGYKSWWESHDDFADYSYQPYQPEVFQLEDNTKLFIRCCQDARYYDKDLVRLWLRTKESGIMDIPFYLDNNTCILNVRGGEYKGLSNLILDKSYWDQAVQRVQEQVENCAFIVITDDVPYAQSLLPYPAYHFSVAADYTIINNARNLILSNSSFAIVPAWLNQNASLIIAPEWWARYNVSTGYWANSDIWTFGFTFMNRSGVLHKYA